MAAPRKPKASASMAVVEVPVEELVPDDKNARRGDVDAMIEALIEFGQHRPAVVQAGTNRVLVGNHMLLAAKALGWKTIGVTYVDDDDEKAVRRALADNLVADRAKWDQRQLDVLLRELGDKASSLPGVDDKMLERLLTDVTEAEAPPVFEIVARPMEGYSYVVIVSTNEMDAAWLNETMSVRAMKSYKADRVGRSRVLTVADLKKALNAAIARGEPIV